MVLVFPNNFRLLIFNFWITVLGPTLNEVDFNSLEPRLNLLKKEDIDVFTQQIQQKIKELNAKLTQGEVLTEASKEDPVGYVCQKQILNITEVHVVEKVHCYNTTEEVCSLVKVAKSQGSIFSLVSLILITQFLLYTVFENELFLREMN